MAMPSGVLVSMEPSSLTTVSNSLPSASMKVIAPLGAVETWVPSDIDVASEPSASRNVICELPSGKLTAVLPVVGLDSVTIPNGSCTTTLPSGFSRDTKSPPSGVV